MVNLPTSPLRAFRPRFPMVLLCCGLMAVVAGCGSHDGTAVEGTAGTDVSTAPMPAASPGPAAIVVRREQEKIIAAFQPLSDLTTSVVSLDRLHTDHLDDPDKYLATVRLVLARARAARIKLPADSQVPKSAEMRSYLSAAIDSRIDAMQLASRWLAAETAAAPAASQLRARYIDAWNTSIGSARGATNSMQDERKLVGLTALPEDLLR